MSSNNNFFGHRFDWRFRPGRSIVENRSQSEQTSTGDSPDSEPNQREASDQDKSDYKRVDKNFKCPTEPFLETLRILDELF